MGNKPSLVRYDGLPPPIIPLDDGKKKKKKKSKKSKDEPQVKDSKSNGVPPAISKPEVQSAGTLFRSPRRPDDDADGQLSKVILPDQDLNIKVYKKSRDNLNESFDSRSRRYRSLPRSKSTGFRKSTDTLLSCESKQTERLLFQQRCSTLANGGSTSFNSRWSYVNGHESPTFRPPGLKGITFPTEDVILKHASLFEKTYVECFVDHYYASLPDMVQLSAIIIAYKRIYGQNDLDYRPINLRDYFLSEDEQDIPTDLVSQEAKKWFVLALPDATVSGLVHLKGRGKGGKWDKSQIQASIDLVRLVTLEAAKELSRIYEYQLAVVSDSASVQILGRHAAERSAEYLRSGNRFVERDSLVEGTAYLPAPSVSHRNSFGSSRSQSPGLGYVSAIFGDDREQRWEVSHVFASCGLRLDGGGPARSKSWPVFMTSRDALPLVYGYRSPIFKKDFETGTENITQTELATYPEVLQDNPNDFHRDYVPLRIVLSNRNSSFDSQSVCSLSTDPRRYDVESRNGRISRQSHTVVASHGHRVNGFVRNGTRTSTLVPSSRYGSMARSVEFDGEHYDRGSSQSRCFQRDMPIYQSERTPAVGGRFQKYSNNRPERITSVNGEAQSYERGTLRKAINGNITTTLNRQMNGSISSLSRNPMMTMGGDRASPVNGTLNHRMPPRHPSEYHYMTNGHAGSLARLPPKPPIRSISTSQYNNHHNIAPSHFFSQNFVASPQTAPIQTTFTRLPPTTETSFDCNLEDVAEPPRSALPMNVNGQSNSSTTGFMDFNDFLKLVENQNANLKSQGPSQSLQTSKPATDGGNQLETDFPEVELRPESSAVMSNV